MINYQVLKRKAVSRRDIELSCTQTNKQINRQKTSFTFADPLASLIAQPTTIDADVTTVDAGISHQKTLFTNKLDDFKLKYSNGSVLGASIID